jgi:hypothetical protein
MAILALSGTMSSGTPPIASSAPTWRRIQSWSVCVKVALSNVKLDGPSTAGAINRNHQAWLYYANNAT